MIDGMLASPINEQIKKRLAVDGRPVHQTGVQKQGYSDLWKRCVHNETKIM